MAEEDDGGGHIAEEEGFDRVQRCLDNISYGAAGVGRGAARALIEWAHEHEVIGHVRGAIARADMNEMGKRR